MLAKGQRGADVGLQRKRLPLPPREGDHELEVVADQAVGLRRRWAAGLTWEQVPDATRRAAKLQPRRGRPTVIATGERYGPADAAFANAAWSMAQDYDDIVWMGHTCHSAVFASLAVAEHEGAGAKELLLALLVANELGGRLGASCLLGPLDGQMWTFIHLVSAAATAPPTRWRSRWLSRTSPCSRDS